MVEPILTNQAAIRAAVRAAPFAAAIGPLLHSIMATALIKRAIVSVSDKSGVVEFARALRDDFGVEIISTGGTAKALLAAGIQIMQVDALTGSPEMLDGRVKTLHPVVHAGILADRDRPDHVRQLAERDIEPIEMVVVNLYPFEQAVRRADCTLDDAIENIDIGGPCLLRAAAKNHKHVWVVSDPSQYGEILSILRDHAAGEVAGGHDLLAHRRRLAVQAFERTSAYDAAICNSLPQWDSDVPGSIRRPAAADGWPATMRLTLHRQRTLKYGENPHQRAAAYVIKESQSAANHAGQFPSMPDDAPTDSRHVHSGGVLGGACDSELSYNNLLDADAAFGLCRECSTAGTALHVSQSPKPGDDSLRVCVFVKHNNACGVGVASDAVAAYRQAYIGDVNAAMGGVLAHNAPVNETLARAVMESLGTWGRDAGAAAFFVEAWLAPAFDASAVRFIREAKPWGSRVRLISVPDISAHYRESTPDIRRVSGGVVMQTADDRGLNEADWKIVTRRAPTDAEMADLRLAWLIAKHTRSNAISICKDGMLIGNGAGQMSRVMSCRLGAWLARENGHADRLAGASAASDAFFPFKDGPELLMDAGITALIQPGGGKRDEDTINACNDRGLAMIFTGSRHFRH